MPVQSITSGLRANFMRIPKPKNRVIKSAILSSLDGVKDVAIGPADVDQRRSGNFKKTANIVGPIDHDDERARRERYGFPF